MKRTRLSKREVRELREALVVSVIVASARLAIADTKTTMLDYFLKKTGHHA